MNNRLERLEAVQAMLLEIGQLSMRCTDISEFVGAVHRALGRIMYAANFYVALSDRDDGTVRFVYFVDEVDVDLVPGPETGVRLGTPEQSPTAWVIAHATSLALTAEEFRQRDVLSGNQSIGSHAEQWMGCPLLDQHYRVLGAIVIQSYDVLHRYTTEDEALFGVIANHVSVALQGLQSVDRLERAVHERTEMLARQNTALREAQSELVRQEKLASLGRLVAGVAHEINTPLGICVTATSHLVEELKLTRAELAAGAMTAESLESFLDIVDQSLRIMTTNTQRAAALVRSFKQVAVDQSSDAIRSFNLLTYLNEVLLSLQPKLKGRPIKVEVDCPPDIVLDSFPGAVSQILTNMVMNSLVHGFEHDQPGTIRIHATCADGVMHVAYADDGAGMDADTLGKLFDPFFTTRRGTGGSGLGAHILYNLVTGPLGGTIRAESAPGEGLKYCLKFPLNRRVEKAAA
jgi:two-component system NtrC family sensor kinase